MSTISKLDITSKASPIFTFYLEELTPVGSNGIYKVLAEENIDKFLSYDARYLKNFFNLTNLATS